MELLGTIITAIISLITSGGIFGFAYRKLNRKIKMAEVDRVELENQKTKLTNEKSFAEEWLKIAEDRETMIVEKDERIDRLYIELGQWRDRYNSEVLANNEHKIEIIKLQFKTCGVPGCSLRTPPTGY